MSVVEDTRKVLQDFIAPELRAIAVRVEALEKKVDENDKRAEQRLADAEKRIDQRFTEAAKGSDQRFSEAAKSSDQRFSEAAKHVDQRFNDAEKRAELAERRAEQRHQELLGWMVRPEDIQDLRDRVTRLEARDDASRH